MKSFKTYFLAFLAIAALSACSDDDDAGDNNDNNFANGEGSGTVTFDGAPFEFDKGVVENYGELVPGFYNYDITLFSETLSVNLQTGTSSGTGAEIYLEMFSDRQDRLKNGTYTISNITGDRTITTANIDVNTGSGGSFATLESGTVDLSVSGSTYTLVIDLMTGTGRPVTGTYVGNLFEID